MRGVPFLDGTSYISQCPVQRGERQFIEFTVNEEPGTYMWHDHKNMAVADGLAGGLIVTGEADESLKARFNVTRDEVLVVSDFFEQNSVTQAKAINAPVNVSDFTWNARSLLLDWGGCFKDCSPGDKGMFSCDPDKECSERYILNVAPDDVIRLRIIAAGSMMYVLTSTVVRAPRLNSHSRYALRSFARYQIICFQGVDVTLVAMDAREVEAMDLADGCVNVDLGQRADVIIKGKTFDELDTAFGGKRDFWLTGFGDYGNPASYGVVTYADCSDATACLPDAPPPQPVDRPLSWSASGFINDIKSPQASRVPEYVRDGREPDKRLTLQLTGPVIQQTSQARWAISNAVYLKTPSCGNVLQEARDPAFLSEENPYVVANSSALDNVDIYDMPGLGGVGEGSGESLIYLNLAGNTSMLPEQPVAGTPIVQTTSGEVVDLILQNLPDGALGGLTPGGFEFSHPFHLHGSHFWVLGSGNGTFSVERDVDSLNFENPRHADTQTVGSYGWTYLRFRADNPGVWPLHCHIAVHEFGGMLLLFAHDVDRIPQLKIEAGGLPTCPSECVYNAKFYNETYNETTTSAAGRLELLVVMMVVVAGLLVTPG